MIEIDGTKIKDKKEAYYPYILDVDPKLAANFLTIKDCLESYTNIKKAYDEMKSGSCSFTFLYDSIMHSRKNFIWFLFFFRELEKIIMGENSYELPYNLFPSEKRLSIYFYPPFHAVKRKAGLFTKPYSLRVQNRDVINLYRVLYIKEGHQLEDFKEGFPAWYLLDQTTIYECYNERTNVRVRIDFMDGEFFYFVAGASDNWKQVTDIPLEIDSFTSALLFKSLCQEDL